MSSALAIVLTVALGILLVVGLGALVLYKRFERNSAPRYVPPASSPASARQELSALGILEIRPKTRKDEPSATSDTSVHDTSIHDTSVQDAEVVAANESAPPSYAPPEAHRVSPPDPHAPASPPPASGKAVVEGGREDLVAILHAVRAAAGAYSAALLRHEAHEAYTVLAIVSESPHAVIEGTVAVNNVLLVEALAMAPVSIKDVGSDELSSEALGYYRQPVPVRQVALVPVRVPDDENAYLMLVDALAWQDLDDPWQRLLLGQFATLVGTYLASPLPGDAARSDRLRIRPRREIIAEEMERARGNEQPLALALVYLNRAEEIAALGVKALGLAERAMKSELEQALQDGRLERFGELTYGVFHDNDVSAVEAWALRLQEDLGAGDDVLAGGVSIGIALLKERHTGPDEFRADATEALREAFETGACTIIE